MKKHKSVVAILLAVMMIFTFMPTMAFATVSWDANYQNPVSDLTSAGTQKAKFTSQFNGDVFTGMVKVESVWSGTSTYGQTDGFPDTANGTKYFYDLNGATITAGGGKAVPATIEASKFKAMLNDLEVVVLEPSYAVATGKTAAKSAPIKISNGLGAFAFEAVSNFDEDSKVDQNVTISFKKTTDVKTGVGDSGKEDVLGDLPVVNVTVKADASKIEGAKFYFEDQDPAKTGLTLGSWGNASLGTLVVDYDGAAHNVAMTPVDGYSVAYAVFNPSTGKYDAASTVTVTDVAKAPTSVKATVTKAATATAKAESKEYTFDVKVKAATTAKFQFKSTADIDYAVKEGTKYDPYDYIEIATIKDDKAYNAAVKANEAALVEFFKAYYGVTESAPATNPGNVTFTIGDYTDVVKTAKDAKAVEEKYGQLLANFGTDGEHGFTVVPPTTHSFKIVAAEDWYEIEFVNSPTSKTYKAKVLKKKAKSFKVKAVSTNGEAVSYKLINAPEKIVINKTTGKITLKKGLKKGTYKIKVKAYIPKSFQNDEQYKGYTWPSETHSITIKVKK